MYLSTIVPCLHVAVLFIEDKKKNKLQSHCEIRRPEATLLKVKSFYSRYYNETSCGVHLRGLAPGQHSSKETSREPLATLCPVLQFDRPGNRSRTFHVVSGVFNHCDNWFTPLKIVLFGLSYFAFYVATVQNILL